MRRSLAIVTPCIASTLLHLTETAASVEEARASARAVGWDISWILILDGSVACPDVGADITLGLDKQVGTAAARNRALAHLDNIDWVYPLDGDDILDSSGLAGVLSDQRTDDDDIGWIGTSRVLLDGSDCAYSFTTEREYPQWAFGDNWESPAQFHANSMLMRTAALQQVGGWPAYVGHEDLALAHLINDARCGIALPYTVTKYRVWDAQTIQQPWMAMLRTENYQRMAASGNARRDAVHRAARVTIPAAIERDRYGMPVRRNTT